MVGTIVVVVLLGIALIFVGIEWRIMRKPAAQRTERETRYLVASRRFARTYNMIRQRIVVVVGIAVGVFTMLLSIPFWGGRDTRFALTLLLFGAAELVAIVAIWFFVIRRRNPAWRARQDAQIADADAVGYPRFFTSGRAGIAVGIFFTGIGIGLLVAQLVLGGEPGDLILPAVLALVGVGALFAARAQRRGEDSPR